MLLVNNLTAQYNVRLVNTETGLSENTARSILKHDNGLVYIGTGIGLSVYDGDNVINISTSIKQEVKSIFQHGIDSIILIRDNGISVVNIHNYGHREKNFNSIINNKIINATKAEDVIYCATNEGLVKIGIGNFSYKIINTAGIPENIVYQNTICITYSPQTKNIYVSHRSGIFVYNTKSDRIVTDIMKLPGDTSVCGSIGYHNGIVFYKYANKNIVLYEETTKTATIFPIASVHFHFNKNLIFYTYKKFLYQYQIWNGKKDSIDLGVPRPAFCLNANSADEVLIGTPSGMIVIKRPFSTVLIDSINIPFEKSNYIELQSKIKYGRYFYLNIRSGIVEYDSITGKSRFYQLNFPNLNFIFNIIPYTYGKLLVLGSNGYCTFDLKSKLYKPIHIYSENTEKIISNSRVITGHYDSANAILILCLYMKPMYIKYFANNTERTWNGNDYNWFRTVRTMYYLGNQEYYLGANGNDGLIKFNFKTGKGVYYNPAMFSKAGNNSAVINQILPFGKYFYLATADGLMRFNPATNELVSITLDGNPHNDQIYGIAIINNELYASARNSLCKLMEGNNMFRLNTYDNFSGAGLPFFANGSINLMVKHQLLKLQIPEISNHPQVDISHIGYINGWHQVRGLKSIRLPYGIGSLQVLFSNPEMVRSMHTPRIMYRFSGASEWQILKGFSFQTGNLSYGNHEIEFYSIFLGRKSEAQKFNLFITRPWWATIYFYAFCVLCILFAFWFFLKSQLKLRTEKKRQELSLVLNTSENERNRISRDFHDGVGTKLSSIKLIAENSRRDPNSSLMQRLPDLVDEILVDVRNIINELSPQTLKLYGLKAALESHLRLLKLQKLTYIDFSLDVPDNLERMTNEVESNLFRIIQELINNAIKHAACSTIKISIFFESNKLIVSVSDNGKGMEVQEIKNGHGLNNVKSRTDVLRGEMTMDKPKDGGTEIKISVPLESCLPPS